MIHIIEIVFSVGLYFGLQYIGLDFWQAWLIVIPLTFLCDWLLPRRYEKPWKRLEITYWPLSKIGCRIVDAE